VALTPKTLAPAQRPSAARPAAPTAAHSITPTQQRAITRLAGQVDVEIDRVLEYLGVRELGEIPASEFMRMIRSLELRRAA
jgi:hypothetical protein